MSKKEPFISIITPAYNCANYVKETLDSVLNQTYQNFEVILIDDCSTDNTFQVLMDYENRDSRIKVYKNEENLGVSKTRNKAIKIAKYDYIAFLDSDDCWKNDKLEKQVNLLNQNSDTNLIYTGSSFIDENSKFYDYEMNVPTKVSFEELLKQNIISCSSVLTKREYLLKYEMVSDKMHEDFASWLMILKNEIDYAYGIDEPLLIYRISRNSKSSNKIKAALMNYRVYKYIGLNFFKRIYYMVIYTIRGLKKYKKIKK